MSVTRIRPPRREVTWGDALAIAEALACIAAWFVGWYLVFVLPCFWVRPLAILLFGVGRWTGRVKRLMDLRLAELSDEP